MANKKHRTLSKRTPTKRQLSRWERERRSRRITLAVGSLVLLVVIVLVGFGVFARFVVPPRELAFRVNGNSFDMAYYVKTMRWVSYNGRFLQIATPDAMARAIIEPELLRQAAPELGLGVTPDEALEQMRDSYRATLGQDQEFVENEFQDWYRDRARDYGLSVNDLTGFLEQVTLTNKLMDYLGRDLPSTAPQVHLLGIESTDALAAADVQSKLDEGQDFAALAQTDSIDTASAGNGGELGWFLRDLLPQEVADMVFNLEPGGVTQPISGRMSDSDPGGFWIFKMAEKQDDREVDEASQEALKSKLATEWLAEQRANSQVDNMVTNEKRAWALEQVPAQ